MVFSTLLEEFIILFEEMLVLLDLGNSFLKVLITEKNSFKVLDFFTLPISEKNFLEKLREKLEKYKNLPAVGVSVKPSYNAVIRTIIPSIQWVSLEDCQKFIKVNYKTPSTLGLDRLVSAIGGIYYYSPSFIKISIGTATVIDIVKDKIFQGGFIFPSFDEEMEILFRKTEIIKNLRAKLASFKRLYTMHANSEFIGKSSEECIILGIFYKNLLAIEAFIKKISQAYNIEKVIFTGGKSKIFQPFFKNATFDYFLMFKGLFIMAKREIFKKR
jgi:type III pantothenate kinase